jgi:hypothetical protein
MTCHEARERILEAELDELAPGGESPLQRHLAECASCAAAVRAVVEQERALGVWLGGVSGQRSAEGALPIRRLHRYWRPAAAVALVAAAGLAGLLLRRRPDPAQGPRAAPSPAPVVTQMEVASDRPFVVLSTANPDVTLVWLN